MVYEFMNKSLALIPVAFAIFALMVSPAVMSVSADPDNSNGKGSANAHPNDCSNSNGKAKQKNPNCTNSEPNPCGLDDDGNIFPDELASYLSIPIGDESTSGTAEYLIHLAETAAGTAGVGSHSQTITEDELPFLNTVLAAESYPLC